MANLGDQQSMSVTNEEVSEYMTEVVNEEAQILSELQVENAQVMNDNDEQIENDENMNGGAQNVSEHQNNNNDQVTNEIPRQYAQNECQTEMSDVAAVGLQSDSGRAKNIECQTMPILMVDKECQTEDVVIITAQTLPFDQQDMSDDKKVKYYTGVTNLPTLLLLLKFLLPGMKSIERSLTHF